MYYLIVESINFGLLFGVIMLFVTKLVNHVCNIMNKCPKQTDVLFEIASMIILSSTIFYLERL